MFTSSENATSFDQVSFRHPFPDTWLSESIIARETEALTKVLQKSISNEYDPLMPVYFPDTKPETNPSSTSDPEYAPKRIRNPIPTGGKITKRKSRASKRSPTTFITADPSNFRQMVQQVTGIRFGSSHVPVSPVLKPEPQRIGNRMQMCLPTLDTSAFSLGHHHQQVVGPAVDPTAVGAQASYAPEVSGLEYDSSFPAFPTLESWRVM